MEEESHFSGPRKVQVSNRRPSTRASSNDRAERRYVDAESYTESEESSTSQSSDESGSEDDYLSEGSDIADDYDDDERFENRSMYSSGGQSLAARSLARAMSNTANKGGSRLAIQANLALQRRKKESPRLRAKMEADALRDVSYNDGATELYKHLENKRWREAAERCRTEPIETKIWVFRMDKTNKKMLWRMLPIHTAILYRAPVYVILELINANPEGPSQFDDRKMLPIHMACRVICKEDVLRVLLKHKMDTVVAKDAKGRTPRDILMDDKRDQDSKVLKKVADRNKKNLLKVLKEYEVIYERKNSSPSVAGSRWSRYGAGDRSVTSEFLDDDDGSIYSRFSRSSHLRPSSRSSSVRPSTRESASRSSSRGRDARSVSRSRIERPISRSRGDRSLSRDAESRRSGKLSTYDTQSPKIPRPETGMRNRLPKLPAGPNRADRRARSVSRTRSHAKDEESYASGRRSRMTRRSRSIDDADNEDNDSRATGKFSRVSRAARGYDDDSVIMSKAGSRKTNGSKMVQKPSPESIGLDRDKIVTNDVDYFSDDDRDTAVEDASLSSKESDIDVSIGNIGDGLPGGPLHDLWKDIENLYPIPVEAHDANMMEIDKIKVQSKWSNREEVISNIKYYDPPNELQKLLSVIKNDSPSYELKTGKDSNNSRAPLPDNNTGRRVNACGALRALSKNAKNRVRLGRTKDVVPSLLSLLQDDTSTNEEKARCSGTLMYLSVPKQNCEAIYLADPMILSTLNKGLLDVDSRVRYNICFSLFLLSKSDEVRLEIINDDHIMNSLVTLIDIDIDSASNPDDDEVSVDGSLSHQFANLGSPSGIRQQGAPESDEEVKRGCRLSAMKILLAISKVQYGGQKIVSNKKLMHILVKIAGTMTAEENILCMAIFTNLSRDSLNVNTLIRIPNLVEALSRGLTSKAAECRKCSTFALQNFSCNNVLRRRIGNSQMLLTGLVPQLLNQNDMVTDEVQLSALYTLRNLSAEPSNIPAMMGTPGLSAGLMTAALDHNKTVAQYVACDTLAALSQWLDSITDTCIEKNEINLNGRALASMSVNTWNQWE